MTRSLRTSTPSLKLFVHLSKVGTQIAQIAVSIPVTDTERIPGQPETSTKFVHAATEE